VTAGSATVVASTENVGITATGSIAGPIWLSGGVNGAAFPEQGWSDFSVALLAAWIPPLQRLMRRGEAAECHFVEGPYHFVATSKGEHQWSIACFERRDADVRVGNAVLELDATPIEFLGGAITAAKSLLGYCDARGWWNDDTERLRKAVEDGLPRATGA
jgi:hypothetical protein